MRSLFASFLAIHTQIGLNQGLIDIPVGIGGGSANGKTDLILIGEVVVDFFEVAPQSQDGLMQLVFVSLKKENGKLVTADPGNHIPGAKSAD